MHLKKIRHQFEASSSTISTSRTKSTSHKNTLSPSIIYCFIKPQVFNPESSFVAKPTAKDCIEKPTAAKPFQTVFRYKLTSFPKQLLNALNELVRTWLREIRQAVTDP
ncbi:hypothetical protein AVEN_381-1 [Araneus ventricosus]|uniref:Uncharacterized protein n=1 Tax=Araneus ventricosus TaxID=182803 RepID=A0A4Y2DRU9_ARAVE|nr:hypothetical protein AVEN_381-1 [Araneus ventricosus]